MRESRPVRTLTVQKETSVVNDCNQVRKSRPVRTLTVQKETSVVNDCNQVRERSPVRPSQYRRRNWWLTTDSRPFKTLTVQN